MAAPLSGLAERLGLSADEALAIFELDALAAISGETDHRPEIAILETLCAEAAERLGADMLGRWLRLGAPSPLELLLGGDFAAFEDALARRLAEAA